MEVRDYLLNLDGQDWQSLLSPWFELLPPSFEVSAVNRFGDVFTILDDGTVHLLDVEGATYKRLADDWDQFCALLDVDENANLWLMIPLVDRCVDAGITLAPGRCYCFKIPPILGGEYAVSNVATINLGEHYSALADFWHQTRDLPNGSKVRVVVKR